MDTEEPSLFNKVHQGKLLFPAKTYGKLAQTSLKDNYNCYSNHQSIRALFTL